MTKLSIVVPVYNEVRTIVDVLRKIEATRLTGLEKEIVVVDDGSTDGTSGLLQKIEPLCRIVRHRHNRGKGAALRTGFASITGDIVLVQDADLEYNPDEYGELIQPLLAGKADAVYGSRQLKPNPRFRKRYYWGSRGINFLTNFLYGSNLTDVYTCYKAIRTPILEHLNLKSDGFEIEAEITAQLLKNNHKIVEVPIGYRPRDFNEGKKIRWSDGLKAIGVLVRQRLNNEHQIR